MRLHNGIILVTEAVQIEQLTLTSADTPLPNLPTGDLGRDVKQVTLRSVDQPWEWTFVGVGAWFWMGAGEILVIPVRDKPHLDSFRIRAASVAGDFRIVYEC